MNYLTIITAAAKAVGVSATLLFAICSHESRDFTLDYSEYDNGSPSYSVCQVKKDTAVMLGWKGKNPMELRNPHVGIKYAALYLKYQQDRPEYGKDWVKLVSAYNAGSYNESSKKPNCPRNLKYLRLVQEKLPKHLQHKLDCGKKKENVYFIDNLEE
jgi:soluble lytic murein transglycosylase-like protein